MQATDIPAKFTVPFAVSAGGGYVRTVPVAAQPSGAASFTTGFPPENFVPVGAGGVPPWGQDMNGILKMMSSWTRWLNAGGLVQYDAVFSAAIGGYPKGAFLLAAAGDAFWISDVDNNVTNPDAAGGGWTALIISPSSALPIFEGAAAPGTGTAYAREDHVHPDNYGGTSTGSANAQTITPPHGLGAVVVGITLSFTAGFTNTNALTLTVFGLGAFSVFKDSPTGPIALTGGEVVVGNKVVVTAGSTGFHLVSTAQGTAALANATSGTGKVTALTGAAVAGNLPVFDSGTGTLVDSGTSPGSLAGSAEGVLFRLGLTF